MSSSTPQNDPSRTDATRPAPTDERRNPLGFADVRAVPDRVPSADGAHRPASDIGFAPAGLPPAGVLPAPVFRTEISFRRERRETTTVRAEALPGGHGTGSEPVLGHAESRVFDLDDGAVGDSPAVVEAMPDEEDGEKVPFYKREITLGRRRDIPSAPAASEPASSVPFYKREITFGRRREAEPAAEEPEATETVPFYKRELSFMRRRPAGVDEESGAEATADPSSAPDPEEWSSPAEHAPQVARVEETLTAPVAETSFPAETASAQSSAEVIDLPAVAHEDPPDEEAIDVSAADPAVTAEDAGDVEPVEPTPPAAEPAAHETAAGASMLERSSGPSARAARMTRSGSPRAWRSRRGASGKGRRTVGLKIGASQIAAAVIHDSGGAQELVQLVRQPIEPGLVVDGEVRDASRLAAVLRGFVEEHALPRTNVRIGLASNRIGVRTLEISGIDDPTRFDNAVRFKAHEVLPVAFHESVLDYRVVEERPLESGETAKRVLLVVAPRDQVEPYVSVCAQAGIRLSAIDLEALGLLRAFVEPQPVGFRGSDDTATVVVSLGHESTTLLVAGGGVCDFTRVFDWGGGALQTAIATELGVGVDEAATILRHMSLTGRGRDFESLGEESRLRAKEAIRTRLTPFARELVSSLQFYQTQPESLGIGEIVITGGTSHLGGLSEALHQMIGVNVRFGDPLGRVVARAAIDDALQARIGSMAVPIGLAIDDASWRSVNLLPSELRQQRRMRPSAVTVGAPAIAVAALAALTVAFVQANGTAGDRQRELEAVKEQIAALPEPSRATIDPALGDDQAARAQAVATVLGSRLAWEPVLRDLSRVLPRNVWLDHLVADAPEQAGLPVANAPGAVQSAIFPTGVTIDGYTYTQGDVAVFLSRLQAVPSLRNVQLKSSALETNHAKPVVRFTIIADLNGGAQ